VSNQYFRRTIYLDPNPEYYLEANFEQLHQAFVSYRFILASAITICHSSQQFGLHCLQF